LLSQLWSALPWDEGWRTRVSFAVSPSEPSVVTKALYFLERLPREGWVD
jgi:hypothetical protein